MPSRKTSPKRMAPSKRPFFFKDPATDQLLAMLLTLSSEVWALRERLTALETAVAKKGMLLPRELDTWEFNADQLAELAAMRKEFLASLFEVLEERPRTAKPAKRRSAPARKK